MQPICRLQKQLKHTKFLHGGTRKQCYARAGSTVILSVLPVHITITQERPDLQSSLCQSTQFITYINNKQVSMISLLRSALLKVNGAEEHI